MATAKLRGWGPLLCRGSKLEAVTAVILALAAGGASREKGPFGKTIVGFRPIVQALAGSAPKKQ